MDQSDIKGAVGLGAGLYSGTTTCHPTYRRATQVVLGCKL
jgi:hypothetical protein